MPDRPALVVITGMSGAGRSLTAKALEDLSFFVIDNLPARLISTVVEEANLPESPRKRLAVVVDTRGGMSFEELEAVLLALESNEVPTTLLFLDAEDNVLVQRFEESRRPHPVTAATLGESIALEREALRELRGKADVIIDTSQRNVHQLREAVGEVFSEERPRRPLRVAVTSFGYKHGLPRVLDLLLDVRFLPNPHWEERLRDLTGKEEVVREFVLSHPDAGEFIERAEALLDFLVPRYTSEGKAYLTIGVGCTGGTHRSVAIADELARRLESQDLKVTVQHRDLSR
ncbi:MAG: RNase adapter RapZ [Acidimicrobiia bacterium]